MKQKKQLDLIVEKGCLVNVLDQQVEFPAAVRKLSILFADQTFQKHDNLAG